MKERPILFSGPMVRAIVDGRKTQTRRVVKPQPRGIWGSGVALAGNTLGVRSDAFGVLASLQLERRFIYCPYGQTGDRLWVRETWGTVTGNGHRTVYRADGDPEQTFYPGEKIPMKWKPCIHMPRAVSRITLDITHVRIERIQEIGVHDVLAEGFRIPGTDESGPLFVETWNALNEARGFGWDANPWVWVIEFKKVQK